MIEQPSGADRSNDHAAKEAFTQAGTRSISLMHLPGQNAEVMVLGRSGTRRAKTPVAGIHFLIRK